MVGEHWLCCLRKCKNLPLEDNVAWGCTFRKQHCIFLGSIDCWPSLRNITFPKQYNLCSSTIFWPRSVLFSDVWCGQGVNVFTRLMFCLFLINVKYNFLKIFTTTINLCETIICFWKVLHQIQNWELDFKGFIMDENYEKDCIILNGRIHNSWKVEMRWHIHPLCNLLKMIMHCNFYECCLPEKAKLDFFFSGKTLDIP
jgi:hypothetical protein